MKKHETDSLILHSARGLHSTHDESLDLSITKENHKSVHIQSQPILQRSMI